MIELHSISKSYTVKGIRKQIFDGLTFTFPPNRNVALLGPNGVGKSTLLRLVSGSEEPDSGRIIRRASLSWPLGFSGGFNGSMTGIENIRFVARIYGADSDQVVDYVTEFSELGTSLRLPVRTYSTGMRSRLAFGMSLAISFDYYLIDEILGVGDAAFRKKSYAALGEKLPHSRLIMASHSMSHVRELCDCGLLLSPDGVWFFGDVGDLIRAYSSMQ
jgi:capsular polysaccharide transport system ATP-binding protein